MSHEIETSTVIIVLPTFRVVHHKLRYRPYSRMIVERKVGVNAMNEQQWHEEYRFDQNQEPGDERLIMELIGCLIDIGKRSVENLTVAKITPQSDEF